MIDDRRWWTKLSAMMGLTNHRPLALLAPLAFVLCAFRIPVSQSFALSSWSRQLSFCSNKRQNSEQLIFLKSQESEYIYDDLSSSESTTSTTTTLSGIHIIESTFPGAGSPRPELPPQEIPRLLMEALQQNDFPTVDAGLQAVWEFAGDTTRHIFQHNRTDFIESAHETANEFSTSFYGNAFYSQSWKMETALNRVGGQNGWIATQVMKTVSSDGRVRRWQWELRMNRRPPNRGCWYVESIGSSDRKGDFEPDN
mmetsp:Transcript_3379/g.5558  ORF Transcript_3379/g.5558 Transcript_3379/m.5558 type:complete len:254 (-) Transcript_3379:114-875(-)